jgi:hypothetical protein
MVCNFFRSQLVIFFFLVSANAAQGMCPDTKTGVKKALWGDLHIHTSWSLDAYGMGTRRDPNDAYEFAKGAPLIQSDNETKAKLDRPLDFAAVTDHSEGFGFMNYCTEPGWKFDFWCLAYRAISTPIGRNNGIAFLRQVSLVPPKPTYLCQKRPEECAAGAKREWLESQKITEAHNEPCKFTTFQAYEWTGLPDATHIHRNVIFANKNVPSEVYDFIRYPKEELLWKALERGCTKEMSCSAITIPHNTNLSNGEYWLDVDKQSKDHHDLRQKYDVITEIFQSKGNSECLNINEDDPDPTCDFELILKVGGTKETKSKKELNKGYVRYALNEGLKIHKKGDFNPLKFGFIGSTDTHNATSGQVDEKSTNGNYGNWDVYPDKRLDYTKPFVEFNMNWMNPGGLAAVWAEENTRESIYAALKRRESFATSGPRIMIKFFAQKNDSTDPCTVADGLKGVPMGGEIKNRLGKPRFVVQALRDKVNLSRIEIVKASLVDGKVKLKIIKLPSESPAGAPELCRAWVDEEYLPNQHAYWYARAFQIETPRWSKYACESENLCDEYPELDKMIEERAWASPIWNL